MHTGHSIQRTVSQTFAPKKAPRTRNGLLCPCGEQQGHGNISIGLLHIPARMLRRGKGKSKACGRRDYAGARPASLQSAAGGPYRAERHDAPPGPARPRHPRGAATPSPSRRPPPSSPARSNTKRHAERVPGRDKRGAAPACSSGRRGWASGFRAQTSIFTISEVKTSGLALEAAAERGGENMARAVSLLQLPVPPGALSPPSPRSRDLLSPSLRGKQRWLTAVCPRGCETAEVRQRVPRVEGI